MPNCFKNADCDMFADNTQLGTATKDVKTTIEIMARNFGHQQGELQTLLISQQFSAFVVKQ